MQQEDHLMVSSISTAKVKVVVDHLKHPKTTWWTEAPIFSPAKTKSPTMPTSQTFESFEPPSMQVTQGGSPDVTDSSKDPEDRPMVQKQVAP